MAILTATPSPGWTFLQWLGDANGTNPTTSLVMSRDQCVQALFGTTLNSTVIGNGSVVASPASEFYPYGTTVRLTAVPQSGNYFTVWGNAADGADNPLSFTVTNFNPTVAGVFTPFASSGTVALTVIPSGFGRVSTNPRANHYNTGASVTLLAQPEAGQSFLGWSGDANGADNPLVLTLNQNRVVTANFSTNPRLAPALCDGAPNGAPWQWSLVGAFDQSYVIEVTRTLSPIVWAPVATVTNTFGIVWWKDPFATNAAHGFYRAAGP